MIEKIITGSLQTNTYLITNQGKCIIVDPSLDFKEYAIQIQEKYEVAAIFLTHGHVDHIDGIRYFDVPIYLHKLEVEFLEDASLSLYHMFGMKIPFVKEKLNLKLVEDGMEFHLIGYDFKVYHTPGHTRGSVAYAYRDKIISGDTLFYMSVGRTDFPTGNSLQLKKSLQKLFALCKDTVEIYPGHDKKTTIGYEKKNNPYLHSL